MKSAMNAGERLQKVLSHLGVASRREAEQWIRAGRLTINGRAATLGARVEPGDQLRLDGRLIRQRQPDRALPVLICHRSPGIALLPDAAGSDSVAGGLPRRVGTRFMSISPLPQVDGGLELLSADGEIAGRLQRAVRAHLLVYSLRVRYESDGGGDASTLSLPSSQVHPFSERLTLDDGTRLKRGTDYTVDYDLGVVTFLHADTLFTRPRNVSVRYEENPQSQLGFTPTYILGLASTLPLKYGELNFIGIAQQQHALAVQLAPLVVGVDGETEVDDPTPASGDVWRGNVVVIRLEFLDARRLD
jgi:16S rRNA U516 pseudouridylate synthase RsuA-like enzyme